MRPPLMKSGKFRCIQTAQFLEVCLLNFGSVQFGTGLLKVVIYDFILLSPVP